MRCLLIIASLTVATLFSSAGQAQVMDRDSLENVLADPAAPDTARALAAEELFYQTIYTDLETATDFARQGYAAARRAGLPKYLRMTAQAMGNGMYYQGMTDSARVYFQYAVDASLTPAEKTPAYTMVATTYMAERRFALADSIFNVALTMVISANDTIRQLDVLNNLSAMKIEEGRPREAVSLILQALSLNPEGPIRIALVNNMCVAYSEADLHDQGLPYCYESKSLALSSGDDLLMPVTLNTLGEYHMHYNQLDSARYYFEAATPLIDQGRHKVYNLTGLGTVARKSGDFETARTRLTESAQLAEALGMTAELAVVNTHLAEVYADRGEFATAERYIRQSNKLIEETEGDMSQEIEAKQYLFRLLTKQGKPIAMDDLSRYIDLRDSLFSSETSSAIAEITEQYNLAESRAENAELALDNAKKDSDLRISRQRMFGLGFILLLAGVALYFINAGRRRQARLAAENRNLYSELNHRTGDNLDVMIRMLRHGKQQAVNAGQDAAPLRAIERRITVFTLIQNMLKKTDASHVSLRTYLSELVDLLEAGMIPEEGRLEIDLECPDRRVKAEFATTFGLIINEHVTNSIKYGKRKNGTLYVSLQVRELPSGKLEVFYADAGPADTAVADNVFSQELGLDLVDSFTEQLKGNRLDTEQAFAYRAEFPLEAA